MRLALAASLALAGLAAAAPPQAAVDLQKHLHDLIDQAEPSIACVLVSKSDRYAELGQGPSAARDGRLGEFRPQFLTRGDPARRDLIKRLDLSLPETVPDKFGSGVAIDGERGEKLILTTFHVIEGATKIYVRLPGAGRGSYADIHAGDPRADLAVLRMLHTPVDLKAIPMGDGGKVRKGDWIVSLSNPFAAGFRDGSPSAAQGIISNVRRRQPQAVIDEVQRLKPLSQYSTLLQTDVRINLGCSGGAVLNMDGQLVGLTTALAAIEGGDAPGGFAIPMDTNTQRMIDVLRRGEEIEYGLLGITVNPDDRADGGITIQDASPGMPAARAGLMARDVITSIDGKPIREQDDLFLNISAALAGSEVKIGVLRGNQHITFTPRLAKAQQGQWVPIASNRPKAVHGLRVDFASTAKGVGPVPVEGVVVSELEPGSPAANKLRDGWFIVAVNDKPIATPSDFYRLAAGKGPVSLDVVDTNNTDAGRKKVTLP